MLYTAPANLYSLIIVLHNYSDFTQRRALISDCKTAKIEGKIQKGQCRVKSLSLQKVPGKKVAKYDCEKTPLSLGNKGTHACMLYLSEIPLIIITSLAAGNRPSAITELPVQTQMLLYTI